MKYKLINKQTGEETLCDKVTIDGFDYYVSDESILEFDYYEYNNQISQRLRKNPLAEYPYPEYKKVIATNNPNIDILKVVDKVKIITNNWLREKGLKENSIAYTPFIGGYNKSQETHLFSGEDMIEFYEWCNYPIYRADGELGFRSRVQAQFPEYNTYIVIDETGYSIHPKGVFLTTQELLQLWKDQKSKIVYYE